MTQTLEQALYLARTQTGPLANAARRLNGIAAFGQLSYNDGGLLGQAYRDIESYLPSDRSYTIDEWIEASYDRVETQPNCADVYRSKD